MQRKLPCFFGWIAALGMLSCGAIPRAGIAGANRQELPGNGHEKVAQDPTKPSPVLRPSCDGPGLSEECSVAAGKAALTSEVAEDRCWGIRVLLKEGSAEAMASALPMLHSGHEEVEACAQSLFDQPTIVSKLMAPWSRLSREAKATLLRHLAALSDSRLMVLYKKAARDLNSRMRAYTACGLQNQERNRRQAIRLLRRLASDAEPNVRRCAYRSLAVLGGSDSLNILRVRRKLERNIRNRVLLGDIFSDHE